MLSLATFLLVITILPSSARVTDESVLEEAPSPIQLQKWHSIFVWDDPRIWTHHRDKLDKMCDMMKGHNTATTSHMRNIAACCDRTTTFERYQCLKTLQENFMDFCCDNDNRKLESPCCALQGKERYGCLHQNVPENPTCVPKIRFNKDFRVESSQSQVEPIGEAIQEGISRPSERKPFMTWGRHEGSAPRTESEPESESEEEPIVKVQMVSIYEDDDNENEETTTPNNSWILSKSEEKSSSSSSSEEEGKGKEKGKKSNSNSDSSSSEEDDVAVDLPDWLTPEGLDKELIGIDSQCNNTDVFPETGLEELDDSVEDEVCSANDTEDKKKSKCKICCKIGAYFGKKHLKKGCPYKQCRRFFVQFYRAHKKCIKRPRVCGFFFVHCCERQHHKDMYSDPDIVED